MAAAFSARDRLMSRREVEGLIAVGHTIFIIDGQVIKADAFMDYHPGGHKAMLHMVGRDGTDEVTVLHSPEARRKMNSFQIGRVEGRWQNFVPPIQGGQFRIAGDDDLHIASSEGSHTEVESSAPSSASGSPLFEPADSSKDALRSRRGYATDMSASTSVTSLSSMDIGESATTTKLSFMDARTKDEIDFDLSKYPPLNPATQNDIIMKYRQLYKTLQAENYFQCNYNDYYKEILRWACIFALSMLFLQLGWYAVSGLFMGLFWHQLVFAAHDAGHMGITHDFITDSVIGIIISDFIGGLSMGWWKRNHNVHHIVTNSPEHDPDIEHLPFFAISHRFFDSLKSTYYDRIMAYDIVARFTIRYQKYLYYPILAFGRFNLYFLSWDYLIRGLGPRKGQAAWLRWLEIGGNVFFWIWFGYGILYKSIPSASGRWAFVLVSHLTTSPLHVQITLSHFAMSTADLGQAESFPQKMLRTTMDVDCPAWLDFVHGGLQFQAIHHLFPRMPRHNLRRAQPLVQQFCKDANIPYALYGFTDGNKKVIGRLGDIGRQAAILAECQRAVAANPSLAH